MCTIAMHLCTHVPSNLKADIDGDIWAHERSERVSVALGPYAGMKHASVAQLQQVLVKRGAIFKPAIEYEVCMRVCKAAVLGKFEAIVPE